MSAEKLFKARSLSKQKEYNLIKFVFENNKQFEMS